MPDILTPETPEDLAAALAQAAASNQTITLGGRFTKNRMGGPIAPADVTLSSAALTRVLAYEPRDLTISVQAGMPWCEFARLVAQNRQMVPLDPPFSDTATLGGTLAANLSGPRRRLYGTARDFVIGMTFATLEGKLVQSGGMVVKNVAGLDMAKLMIGSFGTLAAIAVVNFKLVPVPVEERHSLLGFDSLDEAATATRRIRESVLQPASLDLLNPAAARRLGLDGFVVSIQAGGNAAVIHRYERDLKDYGRLSVATPGLTRRLQEFTAEFLAAHDAGAVVRFSTTIAQAADVVRSLDVPAISRAGSGVTYGHFADSDAAQQAARGPWKAVIEFAPEADKSRLELWPSPGQDFQLIQRVKQMFDPRQLLNRGRLYRRI